LSCVVQKFGGTSVATIDRIKNVANIVAKAKCKYDNVAVVVSAMAGVTNKFVEYANDLQAFEGDPEYDSVVSSGELVTSGLMSIALKNAGINSRSYASWQVPIFTDSNYGMAKISNVDPKNILKDFSCGIVPVVCGFQGITQEQRVTTLGRGGSDLTAVALAAAINANMCEIYSDVDGVYTADPNLYTDARRIDSINYGEMLEMASNGAKVLQEQSVNYAMQNKVVVRVASSFIDTSGTIISSNPSPGPFCGISVLHNLAQIVVTYEKNGNFSDLLSMLEKNAIHAEIFKNEIPQKSTLMVDKKITPAVITSLKKCSFITNVKHEISRKHFSKISVIGSCINDTITSEITAELRKHKIDSFGNSSKRYVTNFIILSSQLLNAVAVLHKYCGLSK
jgi:aspartate kinase